MSNVASLGRLRSNEGFFGRLFALIAAALNECAKISARNGDQPYFGL